MVSGQVKQGNIRIQLSVDQQTNDIIRIHSKKKGDVSKIVMDAIKEKYKATYT